MSDKEEILDLIVPVVKKYVKNRDKGSLTIQYQGGAYEILVRRCQWLMPPPVVKTVP